MAQVNSGLRRFAGGMAVAMLVGACSGSTATPTATTVAPGPTTTTAAASPTAAGVKGGTAYLLMTSATAGGDKFTDMDPQRIYVGEDEAFFDATIMQGLTGYKYSTDPKASTSLVPDAATDTGTANADATQWVFTLRNGLKWQDGSPVTCADYKYGVSRSFATDVITNGPASYVLSYLNIPTDAKGNSQYPGPYKATPDQQALYDKAVVCDGNKITFNLKVGVGDFNYATTLGMGAVPNPKDHPGVDKGEQYTNAPWSDGPYMIQSYTPGKGGNLTLVRNPNWSSAMDGGYRGAFPDKWVVSLGLDPTVVDQRLMQPTGNDVYALQYGAIQPENLSTVFKDAKTANAPYAGRAFSDYDVYVRYLWIRTDKVTNVKIRQAMAVALDRAAIQTNNGGVFAGDLADGAIKPNLGQDYAPTGWATDLFGQAIPPNGDPDFAKKLIADSGVPAPTLTYDYSKGPVADKTAAIVKSSLEKAGFKINLNPITSGYYGVINDPAKQHEFGAAGWGADWPNASTVIPPLFTPEGSSAYSRVSDPTWLAAVKAAQADTNRADQASKWQALDKQASQQAFIIPTLFGLNQTMAGTKVGNLYRWTPYGSWPYAAIYVMQ